MHTQTQPDLSCLSQTEQEVYKSIKSYIKEHQYSPTTREIVQMTKINSTSTIHRYMMHMAEQGIIETDCAAGMIQARAFRLAGTKITFAD